MLELEELEELEELLEDELLEEEEEDELELELELLDSGSDLEPLEPELESLIGFRTGLLLPEH